MTSRVENRRFYWREPAAKDFYDAHGYVIVYGVLDDTQRHRIRPAFDALVQDAAAAVGLAADAFEERFPQNRDLWSKSSEFRELLFDTAQGDVARHFLSSSGARLFHDHAIAKPSRRSSTIPWHQDATYWPLDRAGNSLWTPTESVDVEGGCLKVLACSHREPPGRPQDFLQPDGVDRDSDERLTYLPVRAGETVVLHGLTWHSSEPNRTRQDRLAYLTLWVPASARFQPEFAGWHPTAAHIEVAPGERLSGDWFPLFGTDGEDAHLGTLTIEPPKAGQGLTMFRASEAIRRHLRLLAGAPDATMLDLLTGELTERIVCGAVERGVDGTTVRGLLADLLLQERVREQSVARDVYLSTVQRWWHVLGRQVQAECA